MGCYIFWTLLLVAFTLVLGDDNLREALQAVKKRQRDLTPPAYYSRPYIYSDGQPEDIGYGYQKSVSPNSAGMFDNMPVPYSELGSHDLEDEQDRALEKFLMEYIEDSGPRVSPKFGGNKRSVFREREPEGIQRFYEESEENHPLASPVSPFRERDKARLQAAHALVSNYGNLNVDRSRYPDENNDDDYLAVLNSIWEKYRGEEDPEELSETDMEEILDYLQGKEEEKRQYDNFNTGYDFFNSPLGWKRSRDQQQQQQQSSHHHQKRYPDTLFDERYPYKGQKRYPITKRSPAMYYGPAMPLERRKKSEIKKTDPKVAAELNNIFDTTTIKNKSAPTEVPKTVATSTSAAPGQKEQTIEAASSKPLEVKKKSVNLSDYFGYDRKKKSSDWVVDQYLRSYGLDQDGPYDKPKRKEDIDAKMRAMEDLIVDEAIKYTGAHEGTKDSNEIQEVKDKVMAQLAAAYSLEKMRRALGEFKASIAAQKASAPMAHSVSFQKATDSAEQEKRVAVKKETADNSDEVKFDKKSRAHRIEDDDSNQIKQTSSEEKIVSAPKGNEENFGECPVLKEIEMRCKKVTRSALGEVGNVIFLPLCTLHQICYLCGAELGASSPHTCDATFFNESQTACHGNPACLYSSRLLLTTLKRYRLYDQECDWRHHQCLAQFLNAVTRR